MVHPLAELLECLLAASLTRRELGGFQSDPEQEPPVAGQRVEDGRQPGRLQRGQRRPLLQNGEMAGDLVVEQSTVHSARYPVKERTRRRIAAARSLAKRVRRAPDNSAKLLASRVKTSWRSTPPRLRSGPNAGSGLSATGSDPLSAPGPANRGSSWRWMNGHRAVARSRPTS